MSHSGWSTSNYISAIGGTVPSAMPLTFHARYNPASAPSVAVLVELYLSAAHRFVLYASNTSGGSINALTTPGGQSIKTGLTTGVWQSCVARFDSSTSRTAFIDGVAATANTTSGTPVGVNAARIGLLEGGTSPAVGPMAEVAIWTAALTDNEILALVTKSPKSIRPDALVSYIKLLDNGTRDEMALPATITGTLTKDTDHPRVYYQRRDSGLWTSNFDAGGGGANEELSGTAITGTVTVAGALTLQRALSGSAITGTATVSGALAVQAALTGNITGSSTVTGVLEGGSSGQVERPRAADDRTARRRRDRQASEAYWAARQREANEEAERKRLAALGEAEEALREAERAKKADAKRAAVRKVFAALSRAAVTEQARAAARESEQVALDAVKAKASADEREAYLVALDQLNSEIDAIGAEIQRLYARRREEEHFLVQMWMRGAA